MNKYNLREKILDTKHKIERGEFTFMLPLTQKLFERGIFRITDRGNILLPTNKQLKENPDLKEQIHSEYVSYTKYREEVKENERLMPEDWVASKKSYFIDKTDPEIRGRNRVRDTKFQKHTDGQDMIDRKFVKPDIVLLDKYVVLICSSFFSDFADKNMLESDLKRLTEKRVRKDAKSSSDHWLNRLEALHKESTGDIGSYYRDILPMMLYFSGFYYPEEILVMVNRVRVIDRPAEKKLEIESGKKEDAIYNGDERQKKNGKGIELFTSRPINDPEEYEYGMLEDVIGKRASMKTVEICKIGLDGDSDGQDLDPDAFVDVRQILMLWSDRQKEKSRIFTYSEFPANFNDDELRRIESYLAKNPQDRVKIREFEQESRRSLIERIKRRNVNDNGS